MRSGNGQQLPLFEGRLDTLPLFKAALAEAMKACRLSRAQIADRTNELLQREGLKGDVTEAKLNKWAAPSDMTHVPSLRLLPFLLLVVGTPAPLSALIAPLDAIVVGPYEETLIREGLAREAEVQARRTAKEARLERERLQRERRL